MDNKFRKRGWSIEDNEAGKKRSRPRSNTDHSEDTLTAAEKMELLHSFPTSDELEKASHHDTNDGEHDKTSNSNSDSDSDSDNDSDNSTASKGKDQPKDDADEDELDMFGDSDGEMSGTTHELQPPKKRRKMDQNNHSSNGNGSAKESGTGTGTANQKEDEEAIAKKDQLLDLAKGRLSKWASRLFDPNRPRGLVEAPLVIPLNDEFLKQFGKREKDFHVKIGKEIEIEDDDLDDMEGITEAAVDGDGKDADDKGSKSKGFKVKISNLSYTTKEKNLLDLCQTYGAVNDVNLLMDDQNPTRSKGRAYIVFQDEAGAEGFVKNMNEKSFQGRQLRINVAADRPRSGRDSIGGGRKAGTARYWEKDITTKCFRCGGVGHMASACPNEQLAKPCPLCAKTGHDSYSCPLNRICFNCGIPGHINRECTERRGMPRRIVCGACFISGHHRWECRERIHNVPAYGATCLVCRKDGHFMCDSMKWFFGLKGISCFNCGRKGHHGSKCDRPVVDECARNSDLFLKEFDRAEAKSLEDELEEQRQKSREENPSHSRGRDRNSNSRDRNRTKSQPPSNFRPTQNQTSNYGRIQQSSSSSNRHDSRSESRDDSRGYGGRGGRRDSSGGSSNGGRGGGGGRSGGGGGRNSSGGSNSGGGRRNSSGSRGYR